MQEAVVSAAAGTEDCVSLVIPVDLVKIINRALFTASEPINQQRFANLVVAQAPHAVAEVFGRGIGAPCALVRAELGILVE